MRLIGQACAALALALAAAQAAAQDGCNNHGDLDTLYCDEDRDLVADPPKDAARFKNPSTLVFTYTPVEDPAVYEDIFKPFTNYLSKWSAPAASAWRSTRRSTSSSGTARR
jgi:phosphonate transport system substrate-binding protein